MSIYLPYINRVSHNRSVLVTKVCVFYWFIGVLTISGTNELTTQRQQPSFITPLYFHAADVDVHGQLLQ